MRREPISLRLLGRDCQAYDVSVPIRQGMPVWPGAHNRLSLERVVPPHNSTSVTLTRLAMGLHTGTHIDAPLHHVPGGGATDTIGLATLIRPVLLLDCTGVDRRITAHDLEATDLQPGDGVFFATRTSLYWQAGDFREDYVFLSGSAAAALVAAGVTLVGIDSWSVDSFGDQDFPAHRTLLPQGVPIIEGLNLHGVPAGRYEAICLPVSMAEVEAAPARVLLLTPTAT
jgi:arylformamidase